MSIKKIYKNRRFIGILAGSLLLVIALCKRFFSGHWNWLLIIPGAIELLLASFFPLTFDLLSSGIEWLLNRTAHLVSIIVLFLLYYFVLTPLNWVMKMQKRDLMSLKRDNSKTTYWEDADENTSHELNHQF